MAVNFSALGNWAKNNQNAAATIAGSGLTLAGGLMQGRAQQKASEAENQLGRDRLALDRDRYGLDRTKTAADMIGNPLQDQMRRNQMAMMRQLFLGNLNPTVTPPAHLAGVTGSVTMPTLTDAQMPFLQPGAMAAAEAPKWNMVNQLAPGTMTAQGLAGMGYGDAANQAALTNAVGGGAAEARGASSPEEEFNARFDEIQAAKARTGDWEKAYQQVTGKAWPKGQHIVIGDNGGQMVKDQSKWKKAANVALTVAPIAAAPFTGGASLAAIGAGAGAARSALNGGGVKGALAGGAMGAVGTLGTGGHTPFSMGALGKHLASPRTIAAAVGATAPGTVGQVAGMAAPFLPGAALPTRGGAPVPSGQDITNFRGRLPGGGTMETIPVRSSVGPYAGGYGMPVSNELTPPSALQSAGSGITAAATQKAVGGRGRGAASQLPPMRPVPSHGGPTPMPSHAPGGNPSAWQNYPNTPPMQPMPAHGDAQALSPQRIKQIMATMPMWPWQRTPQQKALMAQLDAQYFAAQQGR